MKVIEIPHVRQKSNWDCGIACVEMVLRHCLAQYFDEKVLYSLGDNLGFGRSVWTIDLAHILVHWNIDCVYHTITCGVDPGYRNHEYYQMRFEEDEIRVNKLFENATELGINIVRGLVSMEEIFSKLDQGYIAIVLIDSNILQCGPCEQQDTNLFNDFSWMARSSQTGHYCGHYIVLCGYDLEQDVVFYKNPSRQMTQCCAKTCSFQSARHSYGTDDDIIFINLSKSMRKS